MANPSPELLDDLCSRFILNVPAAELECVAAKWLARRPALAFAPHTLSHSLLTPPSLPHRSPEKLMFIVEQAHWFYEVREGEGKRRVFFFSNALSHAPHQPSPSPSIRHTQQDFCRDQDPALRSLSLKQFAATLLTHCPPELLPAYVGGGAAAVDALSAAFSAFKATVPTAGVILLDPTLTKVLLVRGLKEGSSWGFPRGKLAKGEADLDCAVRETLEETGFDAGPSIASPDDFIEVHDRQQRSRLFIAPGVGEDTPFAPLVRGEIGGLAWHLLADLPSTREAAALSYATPDGVRHRFFRVWPYVRPLRRWIKGYKARLKAGGGSVPAPVATPATGGKKQRRRKGGGGGGEKGQDAEAAAADAAAGRLAGAPAAAAGHLTAMSAVPGQAWMGWRGFDRARVMACLRG
jgi:mRNA-decapping enzyme subunit 2